jgi:hypothetical protein
MGEPKLYERYDRHEAITVLGPEGEARTVCVAGLDYLWMFSIRYSGLSCRCRSPV